jgi:hypothetical protein
VRVTVAAPEAPQRKNTRRRAGQSRPTAAERAYARRAQRADSAHRPAEAQAEPARKRVWKLSLRWPRSRASFVLIMMGLLAAGVATTLWLSTQAIADSYRLEQVRQDTAGLAERAELLQRDVANQETASSLAQHARELGMVPGGDPARIVVAPDGSTTLVGEPKRAAATAPPPAPAPAPAPVAPPAPPEQQGPPVEGDQPAVPDEQLPPAQPGPQVQQAPTVAGGQ